MFFSCSGQPSLSYDAGRPHDSYVIVQLTVASLRLEPGSFSFEE